jgi:hypothetical protein
MMNDDIKDNKYKDNRNNSETKWIKIETIENRYKE